jgi:hypothetical protein
MVRLATSRSSTSGVFDTYCTEVAERTRRAPSGSDEGAYVRLRAHRLTVAVSNTLTAPAQGQ